MLVFGALFSNGVLYVEWLDEFDESHGATAWVGSIATGTTLLMGPVASSLLKRYTCRQVIVVSAIVMSAGFIISSFATGIIFLCLSFGVVAGTSSGIANFAAVVILNQYFDERLPLAMGIGSAGVGVGAFSFSLIMKYIVQQYSWRGSLLILGAIQLHVVICGLFLVDNSYIAKKLMKKEKMRVRDSSYEKKLIEDQASKAMLMTSEEKFYQIKFIESNSVLSDDRISEIKHSYNSLKNTHQTKKSSKNTLTKNVRSLGSKIKSFRLDDSTKTLLMNPVFWIIFLSDFLSWLIQFVPYIHLPEKTQMLGIEEGALMVSIMGFGNALGKLFFGFVCTIFNWNPLYVFMVAQTLFGVCTILNPICVELWSLTLFAVSFGICSGAYALMMVIPSDLLGMENFSQAYGFMLAGEGLGVYLGPPLVGWMSDLYKSYDSSFYLAGTLLLTSAVILLLPACVPQLQSKKNIKNNNNNCEKMYLEEMNQYGN